MKIGTILKKRIDLIGINIEELSKKTFIDEKIIKELMNNKYDFEMLDEFDKSLLADALYCSENYFIDEKEREKDLICSSLNRGTKQDKETINAKCKIYKFVKDYIFIKEIIDGGE